MKPTAAPECKRVYVKKPLNVLVPTFDDMHARKNPFTKTLKIGSLKPGTKIRDIPP